jgi:hypothetical protein
MFEESGNERTGLDVTNADSGMISSEDLTGVSMARFPSSSAAWSI